MPLTTPTTSTLTLSNLAGAEEGGTIISVTQGERYGYPKEALLDVRRSVTWRSLHRNDTKITGTFRSPSLPNFVSLVNSNLKLPTFPTFGRAEFHLCDNTDFPINARHTWLLPLYEQDWNPRTRLGRHTLRWYLGAPDVSYPDLQSPAIPRQYWRLELRLQSPYNVRTYDGDLSGVEDNFFEIGVVYLGQWIAFPNNYGRRVAHGDLSSVHVSGGGAKYTLPGPRYHRVEIESLLDDTSSIALRQAVDLVGIHRRVIYDEFAYSTSATHKAIGCRYGQIEGTPTFTREYADRDVVNLTFEEDAA